MEAHGRPAVTYRTKLATLCAVLNDAGVHYVLVGAQAGILWGHVRATRDVDVLIEPTVENAERGIGALEGLGFVLARDCSAADLVRRPVTVLTDVFYRIDVLTVAWSVHYAEARAQARMFDVEGVRIPTAALEHLIQSKRTGRLQDAADIEALEEIRRLRPEA